MTPAPGAVGASVAGSGARAYLRAFVGRRRPDADAVAWLHVEVRRPDGVAGVMAVPVGAVGAVPGDGDWQAAIRAVVALASGGGLVPVAVAAHVDVAAGTGIDHHRTSYVLSTRGGRRLAARRMPYRSLPATGPCWLPAGPGIGRLRAVLGPAVAAVSAAPVVPDREPLDNDGPVR